MIIDEGERFPLLPSEFVAINSRLDGPGGFLSQLPQSLLGLPSHCLPISAPAQWWWFADLGSSDGLRRRETLLLTMMKCLTEKPAQ
jgi:hypothetical protein